MLADTVLLVLVQRHKNVRTIVQSRGETSFRTLCIAAVTFIQNKINLSLNKRREGH